MDAMVWGTAVLFSSLLTGTANVGWPSQDEDRASIEALEPGIREWLGKHPDDHIAAVIEISRPAVCNVLGANEVCRRCAEIEDLLARKHPLPSVRDEPRFELLTGEHREDASSPAASRYLVFAIPIGHGDVYGASFVLADPTPGDVDRFRDVVDRAVRDQPRAAQPDGHERVDCSKPHGS